MQGTRIKGKNEIWEPAEKVTNKPKTGAWALQRRSESGDPWYPGTKGQSSGLKIGRLVSSLNMEEPNLVCCLMPQVAWLFPLLESSLVGNRRYFSLIGLGGYRYNNWFRRDSSAKTEIIGWKFFIGWKTGYLHSLKESCLRLLRNY